MARERKWYTCGEAVAAAGGGGGVGVDHCGPPDPELAAGDYWGAGRGGQVRLAELGCGWFRGERKRYACTTTGDVVTFRHGHIKAIVSSSGGRGGGGGRAKWGGKRG